jgi:hypothetical protein
MIAADVVPSAEIDEAVTRGAESSRARNDEPAREPQGDAGGSRALDVFRRYMAACA